MFGLLGALRTLMSGAFVHRLWPRPPLLLLCALSATFFGLYTLPYPYHLDTVGYLKWIQDYASTGKVPSDFRLTNTYLYFYPVQVFGEVGIKVVMVTVITLFTGCYYLLVKRDFCTTTAFTSALVLLTVPTTLIAVTHLKEDYNALLFLVLALLLLKVRLTWRYSVAAGGCYGLALLFKDFSLALMPILLVYLHVQLHEIRGYRSLFEVKKIYGSLPAMAVFIAGYPFTR
jgi:hypothetical protein